MLHKFDKFDKPNEVDYFLIGCKLLKLFKQIVMEDTENSLIRYYLK